jgi:citrate synthase
MQNGTNPSITPGLEGVIAAETRLSSVNGQIGELIITGFEVEELANKATFEETAYLLWYGRLPDQAELIDFKAKLVTLRPLPPATLQLLKAVAIEKVTAMDALRMAAGTLNLGSSDSHEEAALALTARFPTIVAAYSTSLRGKH